MSVLQHRHVSLSIASDLRFDVQQFRTTHVTPHQHQLFGDTGGAPVAIQPWMDRHDVEVCKPGPDLWISVPLSAEPIDKLRHERGDPLVLRGVDAANRHRLIYDSPRWSSSSPWMMQGIQSAEQFLRPLEIGTECGTIGEVQRAVVVEDLADVDGAGSDGSARQHLVDLPCREGIPLNPRATGYRAASCCWPQGYVRPPLLNDRFLAR